MRIKYDVEVDVLMIYLREGEYYESNEVAPNIIMDFDEQGAPLAIEILNARDIFEDGVVRLEVLPMALQAST